MTVHFKIIFILFLTQILSLLPQPFSCLKKGKFNEERTVIVATCDTRSGWKEFQAMKVWNVTGAHLREKGISMKNVCTGENWGKFGFLTKPLLYKKYLQLYLQIWEAKKELFLLHVILMDSDTFWSAADEQQIWHNYDCARNGKHLVVSTEMSCWVGRYCNSGDIERWYNDTTKFLSYSPFVNSGVIMGRIDVVLEMLDYIILNNHSYYTTYGKRHKFDDQYAVADYALKVAPEKTAVDYHQLISASCSIHAPGVPPDQGWPFLCKNRNGTLSFSCHIYNNLLRRLGHFSLDSNSCLIHRIVKEGMVLKEELESLSNTPIVWHGNGAGKRICLDYGYLSYKCRLSQKNITEEGYIRTFS